MLRPDSTRERGWEREREERERGGERGRHWHQFHYILPNIPCQLDFCENAHFASCLSAIITTSRVSMCERAMNKWLYNLIFS